MNHTLTLTVLLLISLGISHAADPTPPKPNVLLIMADDLTSTALSCYGNAICKTPNIDRIAAQGTRFTHAWCNATYCAPSRASMLSGYYPSGSKSIESEKPGKTKGDRAPWAIGDKATWPQYFLQHGYYTARISKISHMKVPSDIEHGDDGADDKPSWTERFNSQGPEWKAPGDGETLENNPTGSKPVQGGNTFVMVAADGDDMVHSDGKTAAKAVELIQKHAGKPFFLGVGFVRPHVPFVAPRKYYEPFLPFDKLPLPPKIEGDWEDIPKPGINYKTSSGMKMDEIRQRKAIGSYYASVAYLDAQVGKVLDALEKAGQANNTIVIFTSDHGYHLGEHDFWAKVSLLDESSKVPLIIKVPGKKPAVCHSIVELLDLYPTTAKLCGFEVPTRLQGKDISKLLDDPSATVRNTALCVSPRTNGYLLREEKWAYIQYEEDASKGIELYDMVADPKQYTNLAAKPEHAAKVTEFKAKLKAKLAAVRSNDLELN
jgi:iduronate 2-sulfatase